MKLLVAGYGFVGKAHALALESADIEVVIHDPAKGFTYTEKDIDAAIIAVSTPEAEDGSCDMTNVYESIEKLPEDIPILIKSTISLEGWRLLKRAFPWRAISFSPEFLRANHAYEDFKNQKVIYIGGYDTSFWVNLISNNLDVIVEVTEAEELIMTKYVRNSFLALKVSFFNQIFDMCQKAGINYSEVANYVSEDPRIGDSHTFVTKERGFGGHCFPKDTNALIESAKQMDYDLSILSEAIKYNNEIRQQVE